MPDVAAIEKRVELSNTIMRLRPLERELTIREVGQLFETVFASSKLCL